MAKSQTEVKCKTIRNSGKGRDSPRLYYYGLRYYAASMFRWINPDPAGDDATNLFRFVRTNPFILHDALVLIGVIEVTVLLRSGCDF